MPAMSTMRPDQAGRFTVDGLPEGSYFAVAAPAIPYGAWTDPAFLERLRKLGVRFALLQGEEQELSLQNQTVR